MCVYYDGETVSGAVSLTLKPGAKLDHKGIKIELIGQIGEIILEKSKLFYLGFWIDSVCCFSLWSWFYS